MERYKWSNIETLKEIVYIRTYWKKRALRILTSKSNSKNLSVLYELIFKKLKKRDK